MSSSGQNGWRTDPLYTIAEAGRLAGVHHVTVRRWLYGYRTPDREVRSILGDQEKAPLISFLCLASIVVAKSFRRNRLKMERIREAHDFAQQEFGVEFPFASMRLEPLGGHILHRFDEERPGTSLATLDTKLQQWTLPGLVLETLRTFDYELDLAARWFPIGKTVPIVVDPRYSAGKLTIQDRRVTIQAIYRRFKAGHSTRFIASDLRVKRDTVEKAIQLLVQEKVPV